MSLVPAKVDLQNHRTIVVNWMPCKSSYELSGDQMIPPCEDALMIRLMVYKVILYTFAPDRKRQVYWVIPQSPTKAITVRPSEFYNHDASSIQQTPSGRMMIDFVNTHFPPEDRELQPTIVAKLVDLVQSSIGSETEGFIDMQRIESIELFLSVHDEATRPCMQGYFEATKRGTCAICLDDYEIGRDDGIRIPCLHVFHGPCIYKWMVINPRCPVCCYAFEVPGLAPWFNIPLQDGILKSISSIGSVDNPSISQELSIPTHSSVDSVHNREVSQELSVPIDSSVNSAGNRVPMSSQIWKFTRREI